MQTNSRKILSLLLAFVIVFSLLPIQSLAAIDGGNVIINQAYGSQKDGAVSNNFVELYNPTDSEVSLKGWALHYRSSLDGSDNENWIKFELAGKIPAKGHFLVVGGPTTGPDDNYKLPTGDMNWDQAFHNKGISIVLTNTTDDLSPDLKGNALTLDLPESIVDIFAVAGNDHKPSKGKEDLNQIPPLYEGEEIISENGIQSKQKSAVRTNFVDTDNSYNDFSAVDYRDSVDSSVEPISSGLEPVDNEPIEVKPVYDVVETTDEKYFGLENDNGASLSLEQIGRYNAEAMDGDGGSAEIVCYNPKNNNAYIVNGIKGTLDLVNLDSLANGDNLEIPGTEIDIKKLIEDEVASFDYGDATSVAVSTNGDALVVAIQSNDYDKNGYVVIFKINDNTLDYLAHVEVGVQPDMVTFSEDGKFILTANEGEPREGYGSGIVDPKGSVSVIDLFNRKVSTIGFEAFDDKINELAKSGVVLKADSIPSEDLEPEYIAVVGNKAHVSLQEANAIGILDLDTLTWDGVFALGFIDHSITSIDLNKDDKEYKADTYKNLYGIRMPDGIAATEICGVQYILTANEGDAREWGDYINELEGTTSPSGNITMPDDVVWYNPAGYLGLEDGADYIFGGRSFTMYKYENGNFEEVFSSGSEFEEITAKYFPDNFNASNDKNKPDNRSGKKGPEPESIIVNEINGRTFAFIALERISGVMVYDITNPDEVKYVNYINSRDFSDKIKNDVSPEGLDFVDAKDSPTGNPLLLAAFEVSGTLGVYEITPNFEPEKPNCPEEPICPVDPVTPVEPIKPVTPIKPVEPEKPTDNKDNYDHSSLIFNFALTDNSKPIKKTEPEKEVKIEENNTYGLKTPKITGKVTFSDIEGNPYKRDILDMASKEILKGMGDGKYQPELPITRAMVVETLMRLSLDEKDVKVVKEYPDVKAEDWFYNAVHWATGKGIVKGDDLGNFNPNDLVSRQEMALILDRFIKIREIPTKKVKTFEFSDEIPAWSKDSVVSAYESGILNGLNEKEYGPESDITRGELASILSNVLTLVFK